MKKMIALLFSVTLLTTFVCPAIFAQDVATGNPQREISSDLLRGSNTLPYDVRFRQAKLRDALHFLAWIADVNIIVPENIEGTVNVAFRDITLADALTSIVKANGIDYTIENGVIRIGKEEIFKDTGENLRTETFALSYATAKSTLPQVKALLSSRGTAIADERTNSLVVREMPAHIDQVREFVERIDIRDSQVLIEAKILESTRSFSRALGIQWGFTHPGSRVAIQGVNAVGTADSGRTLMTNFPATSPTSGLGLVIGRIADGSNLDIQLSAAEQRGDVYVISDPSIVTSNGMSAKIRSGTKLLINAAGNINIGTEGSAASGGSGGAGLQEVETGVELNVTPQISQNHYVKLTISAITSQPDFSRAVQGIPTIIDNTAQTTVLVRDGETTVIGGLSKFSENIQDKRVPGFSRLPIMGNLFRSKDKRLENTELMVFVKPSIVKGDSLAPAQVRVHEVEERRQMMQLEPLVNPKKAKAKTVSENRRASRGNKYIQHRPPADQEVKKEK